MDYGACNNDNYNNLIASGSHVQFGGAMKFFATYSDPAGDAPQSAVVVIDGQAASMTLEIGTVAQVHTSSTVSIEVCHPLTLSPLRATIMPRQR